MKKKLALGISLSLLFIYLSFFKLDFKSLFAGDIAGGFFGNPRLDVKGIIEALKIAQYIYMIAIVLLIYLGWWIRAWRWQIFISPVAKVKARPAFSALMIGYLGNTVLPLRIGEFMRAFVVSKHTKAPMSTALATVVIERVLDVMMLLLALGFSIIFFPNIPDWLRTGGYSTFIMFGLLTVFLLLLFFQRQRAMKLAEFFLGILPQKIKNKTLEMIGSFAEGLEIFRRSEHYLLVLIWTVVMWGLYIFIIRVSFNLLNLLDPAHPEIYNAPLTACLVMLTITSLGIAIPSAPGAVGTYHGITLLGMSLFNIPGDIAMSYALLMHVSNFIPMIIIGGYCMMREGIKLTDMSKMAQKAEDPIP